MEHSMEKVIMNQEFFAYANYLALRKAIEVAAQGGDPDAKDDSEFIAKHFENFHEYVKVVDVMETRMTIAKARYEGVDYRAFVEQLDKSRRYAHEAAIASVSIINRVARFYGVGPIFTGDTENRDEVADFCLECTVKIFDERKR